MVVAITTASAAPPPQIPNARIDYPAYLKVAAEVEATRRERRLTEEQFIALAAQPGTVVLDARSADESRLLHIEGGGEPALHRLHDRDARPGGPEQGHTILIYCNNNFRNNEVAFATKAAPAALNISTYVNLVIYGYRNIYELAAARREEHQAEPRSGRGLTQSGCQ